MTGPAPLARTPAEALEQLKNGNQRFIDDRREVGDLSIRRLELAAGQNPFAVVLSCSDSRVPVETVFDQMPGNLFVVRIAGNFLDGNGLGTIEYGVDILKATLVLVMGHTSCGALTAAVDYVRSGTVPPGHIGALVAALAPVAQRTNDGAADWVDRAVAENVRETVKAIAARSVIVAQAVQKGDTAVAGGVYDLPTGRVAFL